MSPPSLFNYVIGNVVSFLVLWGLTAFLVYRSYTGQISIIAPIVVGLVALSSTNALQRVGRYRAWKREWDAMNGVIAPPAGAFLRSTWFRLLVGVPLWSFFALQAVSLWRVPEDRPFVSMFWFATAISVVVWLVRVRRRRAEERGVRPRAIKDVVVSQCLKAPMHSPQMQQAYALLPVYCRALFQA